MTRRPSPYAPAFIIAALLAVLVESRAQQIAGEIVYTTDDDYPALCAGREVDAFGVPVIARISTTNGITTITATSCSLIFHGGFER